MININLFTTFYNEFNDARRKELLTCILKNSENLAISKIVVFNEGPSINYLNSEKILEVMISRRPTYRDFFNYINNSGMVNDIHIIANTDIFFDLHVGVLKYLDFDNKCLALSRWDTTDYNIPKLYNHNDSQDVWIFRGQIKTNLYVDFPLGVPRCDNRLLYELQEAGYKVLNPAFSIKAYHVHKGQRAQVYTEDDNVFKIAPPYGYLYPHNMFGFWQTLYFNLSQKQKLAGYRYDLKKLNNWFVIRILRKIIEVIMQKKMPLIGYN